MSIRVGNRGSGGFSLAELLVAVSVAAVAVPAIFAVIPRSFTSLERSRASAMEAEALASFESSFSRDFESLVPEAGFTGGVGGCRFWTMKPAAPGLFGPVRVEYRFEPGRSVRIESSLALYCEASGTNALSNLPLPMSSYPPTKRPVVSSYRLCASGIRYFEGGGVESPLESWDSPTNAPVAVEAVLRREGRRPLARMWRRRIEP